MNPVIIVHGGAAAIPPEKVQPKKAGCRVAAEAGWRVLDRGGCAVDAVEAAIRVMELDPVFNAGYGSSLNADGRVRMDAGMMEGEKMRAGAVAAIEGVMHPISVAKRLLEKSPVLLVAGYARRFAEEQNLELVPPESLIAEEPRKQWETQHGVPEKNTVGCVVLDADGGLGCGVSTGGTGNNLPGRVGDSPCAGAGFLADNQIGACCMTGDGENILRMGLSRLALYLLEQGSRPDEAARQAIEKMAARVGGEAGCIMLDRDGRIGWWHNAKNMAVAYRTSGMSEPAAFVHKSEEPRQVGVHV